MERTAIPAYKQTLAEQIANSDIARGLEASYQQLQNMIRDTHVSNVSVATFTSEEMAQKHLRECNEKE